MVLRCTRGQCGGQLFLEHMDDSALCAPLGATSEYVCSLCAWRSSPQRPAPSQSDYQLAQARANSFERAIAGLARKAAS